MRASYPQRIVSFDVVDGCLVRTVTPAPGSSRGGGGGGGGDTSGGRGYTHRCSKATFETVAHAIDEMPPEGKGTSLMELSRQEQLAFTQVNVALEFLKDRGIVEVRQRRCHPGTRCVFEDAMTEFCYLAEAPY